MVNDRSDLSRRLSAVANTAELFALMSERDSMTLSAREVARALRTAQRVGVAADVRVAFCGTHTFDPLPEYLRAHGLGLRLGIGTCVAPYGQYMQQLLAPKSDLLGFNPQVVLVSCALRQIAPRLHRDFGGMSRQEVEAEQERVLDHLAHAAEAAVARTAAIVLVANFPRPAQPALGVADGKQPIGEMEFYLGLNLELLRRFKGSDRVHVFDLDRLVGGVRSVSAERMFFIAKAGWSESHCNAIAQELMRYVIAGTGRTRKCLVVDLDNTLWNGVVGEVGAAGIEVGPGSALGEAFESHQFAIRSLTRRGVVLAVCSKNNPADVDEAFVARADMPIKWDDFAAAAVSWNDKASGLRGLATQLNIGEDSLVFLDDNPAERAIVRGELPGVTVPELPRDPADYAGFLRRQVYFEKLRVSPDDLIRVRDYAANHSREQLRTDARDLNKYLAALQTGIAVRPATGADMGRVHELFNKTNQFNLTTRRYSLAEVQSFIEGSDTHLGVVTAGDRFGPMGTIGVYLLRRQDDTVMLDSYLLSCRALGRGIETAVMNCLKREAVEWFGCGSLVAQFIPTAKNAPANGFLQQQGFTVVERLESGVEFLRAEGEGLAPRDCTHVKVEHGLAATRESA